MPLRRYKSATLQKAGKAADHASASRDRVTFVVAVRVMQSIIAEPQTVRLLEDSIEQFPGSESSQIIRELVDSLTLVPH